MRSLLVSPWFVDAWAEVRHEKGAVAMCPPLGIGPRLETVRRDSVAVNWRGLPLAIGAADVDIRRGSLVILLPSRPSDWMVE